ncbi:cysteine hydrolase family protein [Streptomyces bottropensis]|jgi:nicotinamidase-related amidase|uniref:Cysteine hydrolase n=1 Tax=Streptomyces bottropensis TaxID=42235 RepID=A0ABU8AXS3_9ACTN
MSKIAVLTNDLQYDLVQKNQERIDAVDAATPAYSAFLTAMRERGHHIVHLQLINLPDDPIAERYDGQLPVQKGTKGAEIITAFLGEGDILLEKNKDSGFYETDLHERLQDLGAETLVVTGMQSQICVQTTAADAFFRGYNVWVPSDCVVSAREHDKTRALEWLDGYCATIATSTEIIETLDAGKDLARKEFYVP